MVWHRFLILAFAVVCPHKNNPACSALILPNKHSQSVIGVYARHTHEKERQRVVEVIDAEISRSLGQQNRSHP